MSFARMHNEHLDPDRHGEQEQPVDPHEGVKWVQFTKRTNDPKLAFLEVMLDERGIPHRREGESWHAPILQVAEDKLDEAWALLDIKLDGRRFDDIEDDDPMFGEVPDEMD